MKIKIEGEWTLAQIRQCIIEQLHNLEDRFGVQTAKGVSLYLTFTDETGRKFSCCDSIGNEIDLIVARDPGAYADDNYEI